MIKPAAPTTTTTTAPPAPPTTIAPTPAFKPGDKAQAAVVSVSYAGGINPAYLGLEKNNSYSTASPTAPYTYTNEDWQTILKYSVGEVNTLQKQLMKAFPGFTPGVLGDKTDRKTIAQLKVALGRINLLSSEDASPLRGEKLNSQLQLLTSMPTAQTGSTKLPSYQLSNPADLKTVFKKAAQESLGRNLEDGDLNRLVETYQQQQLQYQKQVSTGGTTVQAPNAEVFATKNIEKDFGTEVNTRKLSDIFGAIDENLSKGK